jgi:hypothetical protein
MAIHSSKVFPKLHHSLFFIPHSSLKNLLLPWGITIYDLRGFGQVRSISGTSSFAIFHSSFIIEKSAIAVGNYDLLGFG